MPNTTRQADTAWPGNKVIVAPLAFIVILLLLGHLIPDLSSQVSSIISVLLSAVCAYMVPERTAQFPYRQYRP